MMFQIILFVFRSSNQHYSRGSVMHMKTEVDNYQHINMVEMHYQKFAKYQRIYRRNIFCRYFEVEITDGHFPSVIQSVETDENFSVRNSVGKYRRKISVGIYRLNYRQKSFRI